MFKQILAIALVAALGEAVQITTATQIEGKPQKSEEEDLPCPPED